MRKSGRCLDALKQAAGQEPEAESERAGIFAEYDALHHRSGEGVCDRG